MPDQNDPALLLAAYDAQLREQAEMSSTRSYDRAGPLWRGKFDTRGFVTYRSLDGYDGDLLDTLITETIEHYQADSAMTLFEWKTRGHDLPLNLPARLLANGFQPDEPETVMVGLTERLAQTVTLPTGVKIRCIDALADPYPDVIRVTQARNLAFETEFSAEELLGQLEHSGGLMEIWLAETAEQVVCAGRLELVANSEFAGLWGGGTLPQWRGQGIYRALTAARARAALARGVRYLYADCTVHSRPLLERSGMVAVTTTTPYLWANQS